MKFDSILKNYEEKLKGIYKASIKCGYDDCNNISDKSNISLIIILYILILKSIILNVPKLCCPISDWLWFPI